MATLVIEQAYRHICVLYKSTNTYPLHMPYSAQIGLFFRRQNPSKNSWPQESIFEVLFSENRSVCMSVPNSLDYSFAIF